MCVCVCVCVCAGHGRAGTGDHAAIGVHLGGLPLCRKGSAPESEPKPHRQKPRISIQQVSGVCSCACVCMCVCVCVCVCLPTPRVTVPGHSLWMKVIASGGQPAAEAQRWCVCQSVYVHEIQGCCFCPVSQYSKQTVHFCLDTCTNMQCLNRAINRLFFLPTCVQFLITIQPVMKVGACVELF